MHRGPASTPTGWRARLVGHHSDVTGAAPECRRASACRRVDRPSRRCRRCRRTPSWCWARILGCVDELYEVRVGPLAAFRFERVGVGETGDAGLRPPDDATVGSHLVGAALLRRVAGAALLEDRLAISASRSPPERRPWPRRRRPCPSRRAPPPAACAVGSGSLYPCSPTCPPEVPIWIAVRDPTMTRSAVRTAAAILVSSKESIIRVNPDRCRWSPATRLFDADYRNSASACNWTSVRSRGFAGASAIRSSSSRGPSSSAIIIIPARMRATRLPGKPWPTLPASR